jgi:hypothetical protein
MILISAIMGASLIGSVTALYFRRKRAMSNPKTKLSIQLDVADYNMLRIWADKNSMVLSDYVRDTLLASVPAKEKAAQKGEPTEKTVMDMAFEKLEADDVNDTGGSGNVMPLPPPRQVHPQPATAPAGARQPQKGVITEANRTHPLQRVTSVQPLRLPTVPPGPHGCVHLSPVVPSNMRGQCQGTCNNSSQRGRVCFWTPTTARNCPLFEARNQADRARFVR